MSAEPNEERVRLYWNRNTIHIDGWFDEHGVSWCSSKEVAPDGTVVKEEITQSGMRIFFEEPEPTWLDKLFRRKRPTFQQELAGVLGADFLKYESMFK